MLEGLYVVIKNHRELIVFHLRENNELVVFCFIWYSRYNKNKDIYSRNDHKHFL